ncbi:MAG: hypothetical protein B1H40_04340 [Candidatus Latescibacteria bacterium 4484_181]|nr:MAG: hypothetical protein B1H40_04340 [Candidatus Latescibacteria bacterium 4484_181]RKY68711.1 MAG: hypothetical protein DRQ02_03490 [Candidatus Latescibacterota bacterium]
MYLQASRIWYHKTNLGGGAGEIAFSVSGHKKQSPILLSGELTASAIPPYLLLTEGAFLSVPFSCEKK